MKRGLPLFTDNHVRQPFRMVFWRFSHHGRMSDGELVRALEDLANKPDPFAYPIEYITPKR